MKFEISEMTDTYLENTAEHATVYDYLVALSLHNVAVFGFLFLYSFLK